MFEGRIAEPLAGRLRDAGLLLLRLAAGGLMAGAHGWPKLAGWAEKAERFSDPLGVGSTTSLALAIFAELFCAIAVMVGAATRVAAVPVVFTMLVAALVVHADDPFARKEFTLVYALPFLTLALTGPGAYSVDAWWARRRRPAE